MLKKKNNIVIYNCVSITRPYYKYFHQWKTKECWKQTSGVSLCVLNTKITCSYNNLLPQLVKNELVMLSCAIIFPLKCLVFCEQPDKDWRKGPKVMLLKVWKVCCFVNKQSYTKLHIYDMGSVWGLVPYEEREMEWYILRGNTHNPAKLRSYLF